MRGSGSDEDEGQAPVARGLRARWLGWMRRARLEVIALWLAARDPRVPWPAKLVAMAVAAYALSPIDLIPDVIPFFGQLDDLIIVPAGIWLALRLIPPPLMAEFRTRAETMAPRGPSRVAAAVIVALWVVLIGLAGLWAWRHFGG